MGGASISARATEMYGGPSLHVWFAQRIFERVAAADRELAVGRGQVLLDGLARDEQCLRDGRVGLALRGELGDASLVRGERVGTRGTRAAGGDPQLGAGELRQRARAATLGKVERRAQRLAGLDDPACSPQRDAVRDVRARPL